MWRLSGLTEPEIIGGSSGAPIAILQIPGATMAPIVRLNTHPIQEISGVATQNPPTAVTVIGIIAASGQVNVNTSVGTQTVNALTVAGRIIPPSQYSFNPETQVVSVAATFDPALPITLQVTTQNNLYRTDYVDPSLFQAFWDLPIKGEISWSLSAESHPSASIALATTQDFINEVNDRLKVGTELNFAGIGWHISNYTCKLVSTDEAPAGLYMINVSLQGRWERDRYNRPARLVNGGSLGSGANGLDPDCKVGGNPASSSSNRGFTSVQALASQRGVPFSVSAPPIQLNVESLNSIASTGGAARISGIGGGGAWDVEIPRDATSESSTEWESEARSRLRMNNCFIDFSSPIGVAARDIYAVANWDYNLKSLQWTNKGDCEFSGGVFGYGFEYAAATLSGKFSEPNQANPEDTPRTASTPPKWQRRKPKKNTTTSGDVNPGSPPENMTTIKDMALNWDASGPTKEKIQIDLEDGQEIRKQRWVYGFAYTSNQVENNGEINSPAAPYWGLVQYEDTETLIDPQTNYLLGSRTTGWAMRRFKQESDKLEILREYTDPEDEPFRRLYRFQQVPIVQVEKRLLKQFAEFYSDARNETPPYDVTKICLPDGTSTIVTTPDPNYVRPMFPIVERTYKNSFISTVNPDSETDAPLPDITTGEEIDALRIIKILPSAKTTLPLEAGNLGFDETADVEIYQEFSSEFSAQGAGLREVTTRKTFSTAEGRPGAAQRSPALYEKVEPDADDKKPPDKAAAPNAPQIEYILCSPGHSPNQPNEGSVSAPHAKTLGQALTHARSDYKIQDINSSVDFSGSIPFNIAIRPMDRLKARSPFAAYDLRVLTLNCKVAIQGAIDGVPLLTGATTEFTAGIDREVPITATPRTKPQPQQPFPSPGAPTGGNFFLLDYGLTLGDLGMATIKGRGNR
jgi:hypothetical protein